MRTYLAIAASVLVLIAGCLIVVFSRPFQIAYHTRALERLHQEIYAKPSTVPGGLAGFGDKDQFDRQDQHCQRLVELGYFFFKRYEMNNLPDVEGVHKAFWQLVQREFSGSRYHSLSYPHNVLEVWDLAEHQAQWDAFVLKHDVPDFVDRFMNQPVE
jgi:hypothetical protein